MTGPNDKGSGVRGTNSPETYHYKQQHFDSDGDSRKAFNTLRARLALIGGTSLYELADGSYLVSRAAHCRTLPDLRAVAAFARAVSGGA
jgi:hypothetical protein